MNPPKRVCAFYSVGPHYRRMLERLRADYPDADIAAWVPPGVPLSDEERRLTNEVIVTEQTHYSPSNVRDCARLAQHIRAQRYDVFAVMFDSPQLQMLAVLSGAPERIYVTPRGRRVPLPSSGVWVMAEWLGRNVWGRLVYAAVWFAVRSTKVKPVDDSSAGTPANKDFGA